MGIVKFSLLVSLALYASTIWASDAAFQAGPSERCGTDFKAGQPQSCRKTDADKKPPQPATAAASGAKRAQSAPSPSVAAAVTPTQPQSRATPTATVSIGGVSEEDVTKYLENWGKPSREAVRATLNPTDENIAAMRKRNAADLAIAAYIANRSGQLDAPASGGLKVEPLAAGDAPMLNRMRATLYTPLNCASCEKSIVAMQTLAMQAPMMETQVAIVGGVGERDILLAMAKLGLTIPVRAADNQELQRLRRGSPFMHIVDVKNQREGVLPVSAESEAVKQAIIAFRKQGDDAKNVTNRGAK